MSWRGLPARLLRDRTGAAMIEFAILGPILIMMLMGVLMIGMHMQSYNSVRSIGLEVNRYTVVEYQKENQLDKVQISQVAAAIANRPPYNFASDQLDAIVTAEESGVTGAKKFNLKLSYTPPAIPGPWDFRPPKIVQNQSIIVPE